LRPKAQGWRRAYPGSAWKTDYQPQPGLRHRWRVDTFGTLATVATPLGLGNL